MSVIGRFDDGTSRWYEHPATGEKYESVTAIISAANSKPWLSPWAAKLAAQYAVEHHDGIGRNLLEFGPEPTVALIAKAAQRKRELAAEIGSYQHAVIEALILNGDLPSVPDHLVDVEIDGERVDLDAITMGFLNFVQDFDPKFHLAEATVSNELHRYAGTLDIVLEVRGLGVGLVDVKSGKVLDAAMGAQLAAYRRADTVWLDKFGNTAPMVPVDFAAVLHLRRDYARGYKPYDVPAGDAQFDWFAQMARQYHTGQALGSKLERKALYVPLADGSQPLPLIEDTELRCRGALIKAGILTVDQLIDFPPALLAVVKGVGPKALEDITALLDGLTASRTAVA